MSDISREIFLIKKSKKTCQKQSNRNEDYFCKSAVYTACLRKESDRRKINRNIPVLKSK
jgi:hypothetical protein